MLYNQIKIISSKIPCKDDDGSDPELSFDDIEDDEDMIEIEQALEGLDTFDFCHFE